MAGWCRTSRTRSNVSAPTSKMSGDGQRISAELIWRHATDATRSPRIRDLRRAIEMDLRLRTGMVWVGAVESGVRR